MKKYVFLLVCLIPILQIMGQLNYSVPYYDWSNPVAFELSPPPVISGYGPYSDSLSKAHEGTVFYEYNDAYYPIETWADYYYWFTLKYWFCFDIPQLYEFYYLTGNDLGMASYIACNYQGRYFPSRIRIDLGGFMTDCNRLKDHVFFPVTEKEVNKLHVCLDQQTIKYTQVQPLKPNTKTYAEGKVLSAQVYNTTGKGYPSSMKGEKVASSLAEGGVSVAQKVEVNASDGNSTSSLVHTGSLEISRNYMNRMGK